MSDDDRIYPPVLAKVQRIAVSTTGAKTSLRTELRGAGWIRVKAVGADVDFLFGTSGDTQLSKDATSDPQGWTLVAGQFEDYYNPGGYDTINWDASASGFLVLSRAGRELIRS